MNKTDDDPIMVAYLEFMVKIGVLLGGEEASTRAQMKDVLRLERAMAKVSKAFLNAFLVYLHFDFYLSPSL